MKEKLKKLIDHHKVKAAECKNAVQEIIDIDSRSPLIDTLSSEAAWRTVFVEQMEDILNGSTAEGN